MQRTYDLRNRLLNLSASIVHLTKSVQQDYTGSHLTKQLIRSGTSMSLNYGEALAAESRNDFIHKIKIVLKEARESAICIELLLMIGLLNGNSASAVQKELNEITAIFVKSTQTAVQNNIKLKK